MIDVIKPIVLGIVQGLTEFLPVSSSGHLILVPSLFGWDIQNLAFDVGLHLGTALAVMIYFYNDWKNMLNAMVLDIKLYGFKILKLTHNSDKLRHETKLLVSLLIATIPVGIIGILLEDTIENVFRSPILVASTLILFSLVIYAADLKASKNVASDRSIKFKDVFLIALSQAIALIPGVSRSGISMSAGIFLGNSRESAARISFLLATPIIFAASLYKLPDIISLDSGQLVEFLIGFISSFIVGYLCIRWLLSYLKNRSLMIFVVYRVLLGLLILWFFYMK